MKQSPRPSIGPENNPQSRYRNLLLTVLIAAGCDQSTIDQKNIDPPVHFTEDNREQIIEDLEAISEKADVKEMKEEKVKKPEAKEVEEVEEVVPKNLLAFGGNKVELAAVEALEAPVKYIPDSRFQDVYRVTHFRPSDQGVELVSTLKNRESLTYAEDDEAYLSSSGNRPKLRKTARKAYDLAKEYAAMEGYGIAIFSGYRTVDEGNKIYREADKNERGGFVARGDDSPHNTGGAVDVLLYKKVNGETLLLTPDRNNMDRGSSQDIERLHKYMNLAGFVNYSREAWHYEIGTEDWAEIYKQMGFLENRSKTSATYPFEGKK